MITVAGYCRVSTDRDDQANSFEAQQRYFREYIDRQPEWTLYRIYADEGITGTSTRKRAQFNRMINDAYAGKFQMIITKEVSRFSRNVLDTIAYTRDLKAIGVGILFMTDRINTLDPEAEMLLSFLASMAQEESRKTSTRVVWGQTRQMERGVVFGRSLLGYHVKNGVLSIDPAEAELVRLIFHKYAVEQLGTTQIARFLEGEGYRTHSGSTVWRSGTVVKILKNEKYVGDLVQRKTYTPDYLTHEKRRNNGEVPLVTIRDHHEPIISREIWELTRDRLRRNDRRGGCGHSSRHVFSGNIRCGLCGHSFTARYWMRKDNTRARRWCCPTRGCGIGRLVRDDDAAQMLQTAISSLPIDTEALIRDVTALALDTILAGQKDAWEDPGQLRSEIQRTRRKKEALMDTFFEGDIPREDMQAMRRKYDARISDLQRCLEEIAGVPHRDAGSMRSEIMKTVTSILNGKTESTVFHRTMLESLTVFRDRHLELRLKELPFVFRFEE